METYTLPYINWITSGNLLCDRELNPVLCDYLGGWGRDESRVQEGGGVCTPVVDSCRNMAETNTRLQGNHPPIKKAKSKNENKVGLVT